MKKILFIIAFTLFGLNAFAQTFNYQAAARDTSGDVIINQNLGVEISILQGNSTGTILYTETHSTTTNGFGLFDLPVGGGTIVSGNFSTIDWSTNNYWLRISIDPSGGGTYQLVGSTQLRAVPFAMYAASGNEGRAGEQGLQGVTGATGPQG